MFTSWLLHYTQFLCWMLCKDMQGNTVPLGYLPTELYSFNAIISFIQLIICKILPRWKDSIYLYVLCRTILLLMCCEVVTYHNRVSNFVQALLYNHFPPQNSSYFYNVSTLNRLKVFDYLHICKRPI